MFAQLKIALGICAFAICIGVAAPPQVSAQSPETFIINLRNTEIQVFAEQVSDITGRTLILDPAVRGQVTVLSTEPLGADGVWELFQSVLRSYGFAAVPTGAVWRVMPQAGIGQSARLSDERSGTQDYVTLLIRLDSLPSAEAARVLRPLVASFGSLEPLARPNGVIVTDTAENVARISDLAKVLDEQPGREVISLTLNYAGAREVGQIIQQILAEEVPGSAVPWIAADERSNTLLIRGRAQDVREVIDIARSLDTPGGSAPTTRVFRLRNGDAEVVAEILRGLLGTAPEPNNPVARSLRPQPGGADEGGLVGDAIISSGYTAGDIAIQASVELNAVIVRGPPAAISEIDRLIAQLDIRRPQVMIEAAIVEISGDIAEQLGVQFGAGQAAQQGSFGATSFSLTGLGLNAILATLGVPVSVGIAPEGLSVGLGLGDQFSVLIQALAQSSRANLLSTPSITTLDNQPAEIVVAQNVPFLTGTFSPSGNSNDVFSTIEREDVGIILRVVPRVHEGDTVRLEVSQEVSALVNANIAGAVDLITNRRSIQTTVLADNGGTIVLGGLITDDRQSTDSKIPLLGDIPVVGKAFGAEQQSRRKQTLFVFLRPTILRDRASVDGIARTRYSRLQQVQDEPLTSSSLLIDGAVRTLPLEIEGLY